MVFLEIIATLQLIISFGIFATILCLIGSDSYKAPEMTEHAKRMYS